jgi:dTDP-glucose pyrophosphorylase
MFTAIREYRMTAGSVDDLMHKVDVGLADAFAEQEGFLSYEVLYVGDGRLVSITTFSDRASAQESNALAADFVRDELAEFGLARTGASTGEVMVSRAGTGLLEPVHH